MVAAGDQTSETFSLDKVGLKRFNPTTTHRNTAGYDVPGKLNHLHSSWILFSLMITAVKLFITPGFSVHRLGSVKCEWLVRLKMHL